ncbi:four-carbon acid sugar kinase family protein, partial [Desertihabitans aurantiacus]|uniref:four-carbon acid sugar kinase family protein n=1 Tax=Desertihabitans aurantiacus TaxID=2282477 RepID=UPI00130018F8
MKVLVLDDDPTGTQSATGVTVLLRWDAGTIADALSDADAAYLLTNTRAVDEDTAVRLVRDIADAADHAGRRLGERVHLLLRGDSTLRGHVFAEAAAVDASAPLLFVPAFPAGGRTTVDGVHRVRISGRDVPAERTEFAADPVFGFTSGFLPDYVREKSDREPVRVPLEVVRGEQDVLVRVLTDATDGQVLLPDVVDDADIQRLAVAVRRTWTEQTLVVRGGAPIAAAVAGVTSRGLLDVPVAAPGRTLLVCGSHTGAATRQLERATGGERAAPSVVDTDRALT